LFSVVADEKLRVRTHAPLFKYILAPRYPTPGAPIAV
jgi:hypothetical protein